MRRLQKMEPLLNLVQPLLAGLCFILLVPLAAVMIGGKMPIEETEPPEQAEFPGKISTPDTISVWLDEKEKVVKVDFEKYVCRVVASEMPASFEEEALKAQAVAARTYAMAKITKYEGHQPETHPKAPVCDTTHCQVYKTEKELIKNHAEGWEETGWKKIQKACRDTEGQLLYYNGQLVMQPLFFSSSGGQTENSEDVFSGAYPYLVSVMSPYEAGATHQNEEKRFRMEDFAGKIRTAYPDRSLGKICQANVKVLARTAGDRVSSMQIGDGADNILKGTEVRNALGLSSTLFRIRFEGDEIIFTSSGSGHGVGMSQYGADGMAQEGYNYQEILQHYYSGTEIA